MRLPNLNKALVSAYRAARYYVKHRSLTVSDEVKASRINTCRSCPYISRWGSLWQCRVCTCLVHGKARMVTEACPKNLWKS